MKPWQCLPKVPTEAPTPLANERNLGKHKLIISYQRGFKNGLFVVELLVVLTTNTTHEPCGASHCPELPMITVCSSSSLLLVARPGAPFVASITTRQRGVG